MDMTRQSSATLDQATEIARFSTLAGRMTGSVFKHTQVVQTNIATYELLCGGCGQGNQAGPFKFRSDATDAARTHANRCLA